MVNDNIVKFKDSLLSKLIDKTSDYQLKWRWFSSEDEDDLLKKLNNYYKNRPKKSFPYDTNDILDDFPQNYKIIVDESMYVTIKYYIKNKKGKPKEKKLRYGLIKGVDPDDNNSKCMLSLVCDRKDSEFYVPIITRNATEANLEKLKKLYFLAEFKMDKEMKIIERWITNEFDDIEKNIKRKKEQKKILKKADKDN